MKVKVFGEFFLDIWGLVAKGLMPRGGRGCDSQVGRGRVKGCGIEGFTKEKGEPIIWMNLVNHIFVTLHFLSEVKSEDKND